ncbi:pyridoxal phosphate-dependent transferase [Phycomyces nitens]|nr:pyridoxal phosphate-dependent transferase [Phycomyces nitens]
MRAFARIPSRSYLLYKPSLPLFRSQSPFSIMSSVKPVTYDLVSDTATIPTDSMFDVMKAATRGDDVYTADASIIKLEKYMANLLGHEAALFCVSGCMTNQLGLRALLTQPPHSVLCDSRGHVFVYECGGIAYHSQASVSPVIPKNGLHLTVSDVEANINSDNLCGALTKVISLENTLNGTIMPFDEMVKIHDFARKKDLKLHLDGARLWSASQATGIPMDKYGRLFDTVSVCLSKGVGAPIGSILAGSKDIITRARHLRKLMGGGWRQAGMLAAAAQHCIETVVPTMPETHRLAAHLAKSLVNLGITLPVPCHTNMVFLDLAPVGLTVTELADRLEAKNILIARTQGTSTRVVLHYQIPSQAIEEIIATTTQLVNERALAGFVKPAVVAQQEQAAVYKPDYPSAPLEPTPATATVTA